MIARMHLCLCPGNWDAVIQLVIDHDGPSGDEGTMLIQAPCIMGIETGLAGRKDGRSGASDHLGFVGVDRWS